MKPFNSTQPAFRWAIVLYLLIISTTRAFAGIDGISDDTAHSANTSAVLIEDIRVIIEGTPRQQDSYADMVNRVISIKAGDRLTETVLRETVEVLTLSNRFADIHVDSRPTSGGETLTIKLTPYRHIRDIRIRGTYPLFERNVLNRMTLYPGDPLTSNDLTGQAEAIAKLYRREGYIDPQVTITPREDPDGETVVLHVDIERGEHYVLGNLDFMGNRGISAQTLSWRMGVWRSALVPGVGRFSEFRLKRDLDALLRFYRRKGFADAELSYRINGLSASHQVDVTVQIKEGPRYRVEFDGNRQFWDLTLRKDITLTTGGNRGNSGVRRSLRNLRNRYRAAGFLNARIAFESTDLPSDPVNIRHLRFTINEGPQTRVAAVAVLGNQALLEETIRRQLLTRPPGFLHRGALVPETLDEDLHAVTTLYAEKGFLERTVDSEILFSEDDTVADIELTIDEGPQTIVRTIVIKGSTVLPENEVRLRLIHSVGAPFRNSALLAEKEAITSLMAEKGYVHVAVQAEVDFSDDRTQADIVYHIHPGQQVTLGEIFISGNLRTADRVLRRELEVQPGMPLSLHALNDGQRRLRDLDIFHSVRYRTFGLKEQNDTAFLFVEVEENRPYFTQVSVGYESDTGLFGRAMVGDRNLFGLNKNLWASGEVSQTGYRLETRLTDPRFLKTRTVASFGLFIEELTEFNQPFGTRTTGGSLVFGREFGENVNSALSFSLERRDQFSVEEDPPSEADEFTRTIFVTTPSIRYDTRDSFVRPTKGFFSSLSLDISKGFQDEVDDFIRYVFDTRYFFSPIERLTFAGMARIGQFLSYSDSELVPADQLFYLGGIRDVRGYDQNLLRFDSVGNPVGGKTAIVGSIEARIDLGLNFELTAFYDIGSVQDAIKDEGSERFRPTIGLGLRYITPIGPMGLLYGHKLDRVEGESAGQFHLSIGYSF
jgi:outer membrane protein insertion porin family